ncbi:uncharacterized protein LOC144327501 [Podarcis muralis]
MSTPPEYWWEEPWKYWFWWIGVISTALVIWMCAFFCWHERHRLCGRRRPDPSIPMMILIVYLMLAIVGGEARTGKQGQGGTGLLNKTSRGEDYHKMWEDNVYIKDMFKFATMLQLSDCWLCMHIPPYAQRPGLMLHGIPIDTIFSIENTLNPEEAQWPPVKIALSEPAFICLNFSEGSNPRGIYPNCHYVLNFVFNRTCTAFFPYGNTSRCYQSDTSSKLLTDMHHLHESSRSNSSVIALLNFTEEQWHMSLLFSQAFQWSEQRRNTSRLLPKELWLICGDAAFKTVPRDLTGVCTLGMVIPLLYKVEKLPTSLRLRNRRAVNTPLNHYIGTQISRALLPSLGAAMNYRDLHLLANWTEGLFNDTIKALKELNREVTAMREVVLQNRYALDVMLASKGGVCALVHSHCCMFIPDNNVSISATINHMETMIAENPLKATGSDAWGWLYSWLPDGSWLRNVIVLLAGPLLILLLLCLCIPCLLQCLQQMMQRLLSRKLGPTVIAVMREYRPIPQNEPKY